MNSKQHHKRHTASVLAALTDLMILIEQQERAVLAEVIANLTHKKTQSSSRGNKGRATLIEALQTAVVSYTQQIDWDRAQAAEQAEDPELTGLTSDAMRDRAAKLAVTRVRWGTG